jgi:hypothetical protein
MTAPIRVEITQLMQEAQKGKNAQEIMNQFNIPSREILKSALMHVMQQTGEQVQIPGLIGKASVESRYTRGKRVDPAMLEGTEMPQGPSNLDKAAIEGALEDYEVRVEAGYINIVPRD